MRWYPKNRFVAGTLALITIGTTSVALAYTNGNLPQSALAPIYHPTLTLYLQTDAAAAWNACRDYCKAQGMDIYPSGPISAYRSYEEQVQAKAEYGSNAATPGTSNHGLGMAVDLDTTAMRAVIDKYGAQFGYSKSWSDASWEWWHILYKPGVWNGSSAVSGGGGSVVLQVGSMGPAVVSLQQALDQNGESITADGDFGPATRAAVEDFQQKHGLTADGIAGPETLRALNLPTT
jgi:hypothetical protein